MKTSFTCGAEWPLGSSQMARRIRDLEWSRTPLGAKSSWPSSLRTVVDLILAMPDPATILWGPQHVRIYNDAYVAIARHRHPGLLGEPAGEAWPDVHDPVIPTLLDHAQAGRVTRLVGFSVSQEGESGQAESRVFDTDWLPIRDETGTVGGVLHTLVDTTDRVEAQTAMRESDARHRLLIGSWAQAVWEADASGVVTTDSPSWRAYTGQTLEEWLDYGWLNAIHDDDRAYAERQWREAIAARGFVDAEFRLRTAGGGWRWTHVRAAPVLDARGQIVKWTGMNIDIEGRKQAEADLRRSEARFRALSTAGGNSIYRMSADWRLMYQLDSTTLATTTEPIENWVDKYIPAEDLVAVRAAIHKAIETKSLFELEHRVWLADGSIGWVQSRAVPLVGPDGEISEWFGTGNDITARRAIAEKLRAAEEDHRIDLEREVERATAELKASRDLLQATMDASTDMIQVFEAVRNEADEIVDFYWILNNHTSERLYGEVRGESLLTRNPGVVAEGIFDKFRRVAQTGRPEQAEHHYVHEQFDGWFFQSVVRLNDGVATTSKDISDWKRNQNELLRLKEEAAEARLRASEERFRSFAENSTDALWIVDAGSRRLSYLNPAFERIWGVSRQTILSDLSRWAEMIHPEDRERTLQALPQAAAGESVQVVYRIRRSDDARVRWIQDTGFPIMDAQGTVSHVGGISQDVTELHEAELRLRTLVEGMPQLVWRAEAGGDWTWTSPQWGAYTGQTDADSRGRGWLDVIHPDDREAATAVWRDADGSSSLQMETRIRDGGEGRYRWFQSRALPVRDGDGRTVEWLGTSTDIDDLRQLQEHQNVLVAELQHRTRNLLGVVRSLADKTATASHSLETFMIAFRERLGALARINGLLSRLEKGERVTFDALLHAELGARGLLDGDVSARVVLKGPSGVRLRSATIQTLALAIHELTTNAVKYGAFAGGSGNLLVLWRIIANETGQDTLHVKWTESGVANMPGPDAAPRGGGNGRMLIERALPYQLGAKTSYQLGPDGVRCTIDLPLR